MPDIFYKDIFNFKTSSLESIFVSLKYQKNITQAHNTKYSCYECYSDRVKYRMIYDDTTIFITCKQTILYMKTGIGLYESDIKGERKLCVLKAIPPRVSVTFLSIENYMHR